MNKTVKKNLIEFGVFGGIILVLYLTGLHTQVFGFMQRGILKTGLLNPDVGIDDGTTTYPEADFRLRLVNSKGEKVNMENFRGKVIFLNLWATWCPPCVREMPMLQRAQRDNPGVNFVFVNSRGLCERLTRRLNELAYERAGYFELRRHEDESVEIAYFGLLPEAGFCLDVAHVLSVDPTMEEGGRLLDAFAGAYASQSSRVDAPYFSPASDTS